MRFLVVSFVVFVVSFSGCVLDKEYNSEMYVPIGLIGLFMVFAAFKSSLFPKFIFFTGVILLLLA